MLWPCFIFWARVPPTARRGAAKAAAWNRVLIADRGKRILVDATRDFERQSRGIDRLDAILITHGHRDAIGGIARLRAWWIRQGTHSPIPCYTHPQTIRTIRKQFARLKHLRFRPIRSGSRVPLHDGLRLEPFAVRHALTPGFPTFGFRITLSNRRVVSYVSDTAECGARLQERVTGSDILIIDGANWKRGFPSHLDMTTVAPLVCAWGIPKIYVTQIGRSAPPHAELACAMRRSCSRLSPAYDGLTIRVQKTAQ